MYRACGCDNALPWATPNGIWWPGLFTVVISFSMSCSRSINCSLRVAYRAVGSLLGRRGFGRVGGRRVRPAHHLVDEAVLQRLLRGEPLVAVLVGLDALDRLARVQRLQLGHLALGLGEHLRLDGDVRRGAADAGARLVHQDAGVRQRGPLALG